MASVPKIAFLDCDVGQPELAPSGLISLHVLSGPLLGPPFTHLLRPYRSFFLGKESVSDPLLFVDCIRQLSDIYEAELSMGQPSMSRTMPLVINTAGWISGYGLATLQAALQLLRPSDVVHFHDGDPAESDFPSSVSLYEECSLALYLPFSLRPPLAKAYQPNVHRIQAVQKPKTTLVLCKHYYYG